VVTAGVGVTALARAPRAVFGGVAAGVRPPLPASARAADRVRARVPSDFSAVERAVRRGRGMSADAADEAAETAASGLPSRRRSWSCELMHLTSGRQHGQAVPQDGRGPCKHAVTFS
jgi:hypothetical protein